MSKKKPTYSGFQSSGYYNASNIAALQALASNYTTDQAALRQQAEAAYKPTYDAQVLALQQQLASALNGYNNQLTGLDQTYETQRRSTNGQYDQSNSSAMNALTKRGLGRSSIVGVTSGSIENARNQALNDIANKEGDAYSDIYNNIALANSQNAASLTGLSNDYSTQLESRMNDLYNTNNTALTNLQLQAAQLQQSAYQDYINQWNKTHKKSSGGSRSRRSSSSSSTKPTTNSTASTLAGSGSKTSTSSTGTPPRSSNLHASTAYGVNY